MSNPVDQHYVPKTYLKSFANLQKVIYQVKREYRKISQTTISKICYEPNYFTIRREETKLLNKIADPFHIEKNAFKKQENNYGKILKKITLASLKETQISRTEVRSFLEILITIKRRNPTVRKVLMENYLNYINSMEFKKRIEPGMELARKVDKIDPDEYVQNFLKEINSDSNRLNDTYLLSFLGNEQKVIERVLDTLMQFKLFINHAPPGMQYITSDNPGFTVVEDIVTNYGGLGQEFLFVFPLTPLCCLIVDASEPEDPYVLHKPVHIRHVGSSSVVLTNKSTASVSREKIFSYSKHVLMQFLESELHF